jgi:hypothetical protein
MRSRTKGVAFAVAAVGALLAGCILAVVFPRSYLVWVIAGFVGYLACGRRAMVLWHLDERVFDHPHRHLRSRGHVRLIACLLLAAAATPLLAQQTIFNVPSADVLDRGKVYAEVDELFRPTDPEFSSTTVRGVVGVVPRFEAGVNFGGLVSPGPVVPTASVAVKIQPLKIGDFAVTVGGFGLFYLRGSEDGSPAGQGWGHLSYRLPGIGARITVGGWYASAGYARPGSTGGALAALEQPLPFIKGLSLAADWWSGENAIGYVSPGLVYGFGQWTAYAAYSIKNGDSKGNAGLIELGYAF